MTAEPTPVSESCTDTELALSVVVVTYNEEDRIRDCLESVFVAGRTVDAFEVILVDSNSTDRTVEYASEYPITILQIPSDDLTTPGAGRYVGTQAANGDAILFVDGDMVLNSAWLPTAMTCLQSEPDIAAVDGHLNSVEAANRQSVDSVRGVALYDSDALRSVGGFDPHLRSLEDIHLGYQLTTAGYRLVRLPVVAAEHPEPKPFVESVRRWKRGYTVGTGQILRASIGSPRLFVKYLYRFRFRLFITSWLCLGLISLVTVTSFLLWLALSIGGFAVVARRLGVLGAIEFGYLKLVGMVGLLIGLGISPRSPESFPLDRVEAIQHGAIHRTPDIAEARTTADSGE